MGALARARIKAERADMCQGYAEAPQLAIPAPPDSDPRPDAETACSMSEKREEVQGQEKDTPDNRRPVEQRVDVGEGT